MAQIKEKLSAPRVGFEPTTNRLTADRSTTELPRNAQSPEGLSAILAHFSAMAMVELREMNATGLILYTRPGCPFSAKVLLELAVMGLEVEEKSIKDRPMQDELLEKGGKLQTPYLIDTETGSALYESDAIIAYLHERFGQP